MGMLAGSVVVSYVSSPIATWSWLIVLLSIHLAMNHAAVRAVSLHSLNRQRANIVLSNLLVDNRVMTPDEVSTQERIFEWDGVLRWRGSLPFAKATIGVPLHSLLKTLAPAHNVTGAIRDGDRFLERLISIYSHEDFLVWYDSPKRTAYIVLKGQASAKAQLKAWALALWGAHRFGKQHATGAYTDNMLQLLEMTLRDISNQWDDSIERIRAAGWDVDIANLETSPGSRIRLTAESLEGMSK
ncbi:MAG: hypothetical protein ALECFALPRED_008732 [Alectoria fallacina]|uniref:Protein root UVB sensitive/RUS domain-containing protein n=1 Tax=Alectoria fallacina TaxID=1903189 RepID=A0A8H3IA91_9LECA|nr:MAG: hypothetical protein ALECFALPRED_008732 [Alectoria fallacina]